MVGGAATGSLSRGGGGTGLIESVAQRAGVSPEVATIAISTLLPMVIRHLAPAGQPAPQSQFGGLAQQFLSRFL